MKTLRLLVPAVLFALAATACGTPTNAATVNGAAIKSSEFEKESKALAANSAYAAHAEQSGIQVAEKGRLTPDLTATWLTQLVNYEIVDHELARRKLAVSDADRQQATEGVAGLFGSQAAWDAFPQWFKDRMIERQARLVALTWSFVGGRPPADDAAKRAAFESTYAKWFKTYCVEQILVGDEATARTIAQKLQQDPSQFTALADKYNYDPQSKQVVGSKNGTDLGCTTPTQYVQPFAQAVVSQPVGKWGEPVQSQFGWHVVLVKSIDESKTPAYDAVAASLAGALQQGASQFMSSWFVTAAKNAKVTAASQYGKAVHDPSSGQLYISPKGASSSSGTETPTLDTSGLGTGG